MIFIGVVIFIGCLLIAGAIDSGLNDIARSIRSMRPTSIEVREGDDQFGRLPPEL